MTKALKPGTPATPTAPTASTTKDRIAYNEVLDALWELESWAHQASRGEGSNDTEDVAEGKRLVDELVKKARKHREAHHDRA